MSKRPMRPILRTLFPLALVVALAGCGQEGMGYLGFSSHGSEGSSGGSGGSGGGSGGSSGTGSSGGVSPGDGGPWTPPPPSQTPQAGGFQETIAPLLDANGCTECHHHGRPIDLTTYPFMAGTATDTANQLVASLGKDMPPAPRTPPPQSVIDQVNAWIAAGMKP
jgi:hypothetical protein